MHTIAQTLVAGLLALPLTAQDGVDPEVLRGRVTDPDGAPVARAMVEVHRAPSDGFGGLDLAYGLETRLLSRRPTTKDGQFALHVPRGLPVRLVVDLPGFAIERRKGLFGGETVDVQLQLPATWTGRIVREDGTPMAHAFLHAYRTGSSGQLFRCHTDDDGRFRQERLMPGAAGLSINPVEAAIPRRESVTLVGGESTHSEVTVVTGVPLRGRVLDADSGEPIVGAEVAVGWVFRKFVRSAPDGRYELQGIGGPYANSIHCRAPGYIKQQLERPKDPTGPVAHDFRLKRGYVATGQILDVDGTPARGVYVAGVGSHHDGTLQRTDWPSTRTDEDGRYRLTGLRTDLQHVLLVRRDDRATLVFDFPGGPIAGEDLALADVTLRERRVLSGRVLDATGGPKVGCYVKLDGTNAEHVKLDSLLDGYVAQREGRTDSLGRFFFGDLTAGTYQLTVGPRDAREVIGDLRVTADEDPEPLEIRL